MLDLPEEGFLVTLEYGSVSTAELFARLLAVTDEDALRVLTFLMAESLPAGSAAVEALGHLLAVDMEQWWTPDAAFFELLRDKSTGRGRCRTS